MIILIWHKKCWYFFVQTCSNFKKLTYDKPRITFFSWIESVTIIDFFKQQCGATHLNNSIN